MNVVSEIQSIEKEQIKFLTFSKSEVLRKKNDQLNRFLDLKRALALGNLERGKVKITFVDDIGLKMVETTIWALTDESVILKKSTIIPLQRILKVA
ncbi:hypothetical protein CXF68_08700 [Tenacibaculum sp. Bg11-29]|uniref:hypothetical protein n=1 Tax=Tenacibaculum sp. Bg11-29 TaxID=2058306 RepID=UPI000C322055|nr:hypothetical protein [Tenacibaculum sp. Bg11-29]PKH50762.1 hypothetical protein CXF68_08700 [Tenacibaculum sp. Bg11-29]